MSQYRHLEAVSKDVMRPQNYHFTVHLARFRDDIYLLMYLSQFMNVVIDYSLGVRCQLGRKFCPFLQSHVICMAIYCFSDCNDCLYGF